MSVSERAVGADTRWALPGRGTVAAVAAAVRELQGANPLRTVLVVTPIGSTAATLRRLLPSVGGRGVAGIRFTTPPDLALDLAPAEVRLRRPVTPLLLTAAVHAELAERCPRALEPVRDHPATVDALVLAADRLGAVALADDGEAVADGLAVGSAVRRAMVGVAVSARQAVLATGARDEATALAAARQALADGTAWVAHPVVVVATDTFHPAQLPLLHDVVGRAPAAVVVASPAAAHDTDLVAQLAALHGDAATSVQTLPAAAPTRVVSCPDHDEEVRWVVRTVVGLLTGPDPVPPDDVVVLFPPGSRYARGLRDEFERTGVHVSGPTAQTLAGSTAGQALRLVLDAFDEACDREHVLHLVSVAPEWPFAEGRPRAAARWRRLCRQAGVVTEADWSEAGERLAAVQQRRRERAQRHDPDVDPSVVTERDTWDLEAMARLVGLADRLRASAGAYRRARSWQEATGALARELARHIGDDGWREAHWADAPVWQRRAAEQIVTLLAALPQLDEPAVALPFTSAALRRIVAAELDRPVQRAGDAAQGVRLLPLQHGICLDAAHLFVVGLDEGTLPPRRVDDLIVPRDLPDPCAAVVEHADWHRRRLRRAWDAVLAGQAEVTATFARSDLRRGGDLYPSSWIAGAPVQEHASHRAGLAAMAPLSAAEVLETIGARCTPAAHDEALAASAVLRRRAVALASRSGDEATVFDGMVGPHPEHDPTRGVQAITRFESHASCGLSYFVERVLHVDTGTDPSEITEIEPLTRGNLVHHVLETIVREWLAIEPADRPAWLQGAHLDATAERAVRVLDEAADELRHRRLLGHPHAWAIERELVVRAIVATLRRDASAGITPVAVEFEFGYPDVAAPPVEFEVDGLGTVRFAGRVDRVDLAGGGLVVTDFKTSTAAAPRRINKADVEAGTKLQLPVYARAVAAHAAALGAPDGAAARARYVYLRRDTSEPVDWRPEHDGVPDVVVPHTARRLLAGDFRPSVPGEWGAPAIAPDDLGLGDLAARAGRWHTAPDLGGDQPALPGVGG